MVGRRADGLRHRCGSNFTAADGNSARLALRLTIKPVWDPDIQRRGIAPSDAERTKVRQEVALTVAVADGVVARKASAGTSRGERRSTA
jgi:hypothetical protein